MFPFATHQNYIFIARCRVATYHMGNAAIENREDEKVYVFLCTNSIIIPEVFLFIIKLPFLQITIENYQYIQPIISKNLLFIIHVLAVNIINISTCMIFLAIYRTIPHYPFCYYVTNSTWK